MFNKLHIQINCRLPNKCCCILTYCHLIWNLDFVLHMMAEFFLHKNRNRALNINKEYLTAKLIQLRISLTKQSKLKKKKKT